MRILYVEDDPLDADLTRRALSKTRPDFRLEVVGTQAEALAQLEAGAGPGYDLVLSDWRLPDGDGLALLNHIRLHDLPVAVVLITGAGDEERAVAALKAGADDYVIKRDDYLVRLPAILESALARYHAETTRRTRPIRVLYAEHNPSDADLTRRHLARYAPHIQLEVVHTALEVLQRFPTGGLVKTYDLLLLDYRLPDLNALEILKEVRQVRRLDIPVVLVTGQGGEEVALQVLKLGAADYLVKHESYLYQLPAVLENAFYRAQLTREQAALRQSEAYFRSLIENISDIITVLDNEGTIRFESPSIERILGYKPDELIGQNAFDFIHPDDLPAMKNTLTERLSSPGPAPSIEIRLRHKNGSWRDFEVIGSNLLDDPVVKGIVVASWDITERKQLEAQLSQSQKMEAVGRLAGGIAHDFNNILTVIIGCSGLSLAQLEPDHAVVKEITQIQQAAERAASLIRQLLAFSRKQVLRPTVFNLNTVVTNLENMLRRLIGEDIELIIVLDEKLGQVKADEGQIEQVIMNLVVNARDAMPTGGKLTVETINVILDETYARQHIEVQPGPYVMLAVNDTGYGVAPELLPYIFDPFFTTKEQDKGTGLGLATVHGIIKQSGGHIFVYSEVGRGTTFKIYLPQVETSPEADQLAQSSPISLNGSETILLVEDDPNVRQLVRDLLEKRGYTVLEARHGEMALKISQEYAGPIHMLLADVIIPGGICGPQLAKSLMKQRPEMRVLYMSGYTDTTIAHYGFSNEGLAFLQKPFTQKALLQKVHQILMSSDL